MFSKKTVFGLLAILVAYLWFVYVKRGPVYKTDKSLKGKTVLLTGGNTGIGKATAIELARKDARIIIASRNATLSALARKEIIEVTGNDQIVAMNLDLGDYESVRSFAKEFIANEKHLDYLINNAGVLTVKGKTKEGFNRMFKINHLGPFLLTNLLLDMMKAQSKTREVRIINLSSIAHQGGTINKDVFYLDAQTTYELFSVYGNSKLANIYFTSELDKRLKDFNITVYSVHPGAVYTNIGDDLHWVFKAIVSLPAWLVIRDPYYGCQTTLYCALDDDVVQQSGSYFTECRRKELAPHATDESIGKFLWDESLKMTGLVSNKN